MRQKCKGVWCMLVTFKQSRVGFCCLPIMSSDDNVKGLNLRLLVKTEWPRPSGLPVLKASLGEGEFRRLEWDWAETCRVQTGSHWEQGPCWHAAHSWLWPPDLYIGPYFGHVPQHSSCALKWPRAERMSPRAPNISTRAFPEHLLLDHYIHFRSIFYFGAAFLFSLEALRILF